MDIQSLVSELMSFYLIKLNVCLDVSFKVKIFDIFLINLKIGVPSEAKRKLMIVCIMYFYLLFEATFTKCKSLSELRHILKFYFWSHLNPNTIFWYAEDSCISRRIDVQTMKWNTISIIVGMLCIEGNFLDSVDPWKHEIVAIA